MPSKEIQELMTGNPLVLIAVSLPASSQLLAGAPSLYYYFFCVCYVRIFTLIKWSVVESPRKLRNIENVLSGKFLKT